MKRLLVPAVVLGLLCIASAADCAGYLRLSQIFAGGGDSGTPTYSQDYVELFDVSPFYDVDLSGWAIERLSPGDIWGATSANIFVLPAGTRIRSCSYLLIAMPPGSAQGSQVLPAPDLLGTVSLVPTSGTLGLFSHVNAVVACGSETGLQDKVAYGPSGCPEGQATGALSNTTAAVRNREGQADSDDNLADFTIASTFVPHNAASGMSSACLATPARHSTWGEVKSRYY